MHKLVIHKLGPIEDCSIDCSSFMTLTGFQAAGKSTIAKAIFFFRTVKEDIYKLAEEKALFSIGALEFSNMFLYDTQSKYTKLSLTLKNLVINFLREKFLRVFGSSWGMDNSMRLEYYYSENCSICISLKEETGYSTPNYIWIDLSSTLIDFLDDNDSTLNANSLGVPDEQKHHFIDAVNALFDDSYEITYIPAGRSVLTTFSQQFNYIYSTIKNSQKNTIDYCTQKYIEKILQIKPEFSNGLEGLKALYLSKSAKEKEKQQIALSLINEILRGKYQYVNNEERIVLSNSKYVKINFASSGQQEAIWILNLLFYYLVRNTPVLFIVEEPESHLFPESQKYVTELISLLKNNGNSVVITTHSPYVLGALNNIIYAGQLPENFKSQASNIISNHIWINQKEFCAFFVKEGHVENCIDDEIHLIQNERIDEISKVINDDFDKLFNLQFDE